MQNKLKRTELYALWPPCHETPAHRHPLRVGTCRRPYPTPVELGRYVLRVRDRDPRYTLGRMLSADSRRTLVVSHPRKVRPRRPIHILLRAHPRWHTDCRYRAGIRDAASARGGGPGRSLATGGTA